VFTFKRIKGLVLALAVGAFFLNGCGAGTKVSPTSTDEQVGTVHEGGDKPATYEAVQGDTLRKIAARADVYGDADMWPLLVQANEDVLNKGLKVTPGMQLKIPRDVTDDEKESARNKARQSLAAAKAASANKPIVPMEKVDAGNTQNAAVGGASMETPVPPQPVPKPKGGGFWLPILLILLFLLLLAAVILLYFMRKEQSE
jgi:hypothetical protein